MIRQAMSFIAVVQAGSFSKAASNTGLSKAQLSRHVQQLEAELGIQLLFRTTRKLSLTESGHQFFTACHDMHEAFQAVVNNVKDDFAKVSGQLAITAPITLGTEIIAPLLPEFCRLYPDLKLKLSLTSQQEDLIAEQYDMAIRIAPNLPDSSLRMRCLAELEVVLYASPEYLSAAPPLTHPNELNHHTCITSVNRSTTSRQYFWPFLIDNKIVKCKTNNSIEMDNSRAHITLAVNGVGIGRAPKCFITQELAAGRLVEVLTQYKQPNFYVYLLLPNQAIYPKKTKIFADFLSQKMHAMT